MDGEGHPVAGAGGWEDRDRRCLPDRVVEIQWASSVHDRHRRVEGRGAGDSHAVDNSGGRHRASDDVRSHRRATLALARGRALLGTIPVVRILPGVVVALKVGLLAPVCSVIVGQSPPCLRGELGKRLLCFLAWCTAATLIATLLGVLPDVVATEEDELVARSGDPVGVTLFT